MRAERAVRVSRLSRVHLVWLGTVLFTPFPGSSQAPVPGPEAVVLIARQGAVQSLPAAAPQPEAAVLGPLVVGDTLETGPHERALLRTVGYGNMIVGPMTRLSVERDEDGGILLRLWQGLIGILNRDRSRRLAIGRSSSAAALNTEYQVLASRLEGLNKYLGTNTLASRSIHQAAAHALPSRPVGAFLFQGFDHPAEVVELLPLPAAGPDQAAWREAFAAALGHFRGQRFDAAEDGFRRALSLCPSDTVASFYLTEGIPRARAGPPGAGGAGVVVVPGK